MQQLEQLAELGQEEQKRVNQVIETLKVLGDHGEDVAEVAHDARNMVTALDLYCDLLQQPGVLCEPFAHYGGELRLVAAASRRLVEKLSNPPSALPSARSTRESDFISGDATSTSQPADAHHARPWRSVPTGMIKNMAEEILANRNLLAALAGPTIALTVDVQGGAMPVHMTSEDLTRILVNLVKNAAEAMSAVGRIHISLWETCGESVTSPWITLNVEDNGPGLPEKVLEKVFEPRTATRSVDPLAKGEWPLARRGLGLSITRSIVEAAGGFVNAANRDPSGACFQIELPVQL